MYDQTITFLIYVRGQILCMEASYSNNRLLGIQGFVPAHFLKQIRKFFSLIYTGYSGI